MKKCPGNHKTEIGTGYWYNCRRTEDGDTSWSVLCPNGSLCGEIVYFTFSCTTDMDRTNSNLVVMQDPDTKYSLCVEVHVCVGM